MVGAAPGRSSPSGVSPDIHQDKLEGKMQVVGKDHHSNPEGQPSLSLYPAVNPGSIVINPA